MKFPSHVGQTGSIRDSKVSYFLPIINVVDTKCNSQICILQLTNILPSHFLFHSFIADHKYHAHSFTVKIAQKRADIDNFENYTFTIQLYMYFVLISDLYNRLTCKLLMITVQHVYLDQI